MSHTSCVQLVDKFAGDQAEPSELVAESLFRAHQRRERAKRIDKSQWSGAQGQESDAARPISAKRRADAPLRLDTAAPQQGRAWPDGWKDSPLERQTHADVANGEAMATATAQSSSSTQWQPAAAPFGTCTACAGAHTRCCSHSPPS